MPDKTARRIELIIHVLIWGGIFLLLLLRVRHLGSFNKEDGSLYLPLIYGLISNLFLFYANTAYLIPRFLPSKKIRSYIVWLLFLFLTVTFIESILDFITSAHLFSTEDEPFNSHLILNLIVNAIIISLSIGYGFIKNWIVSENQKEKLIKEKLSAELNYLKAQVHPHFLFNTLNTAYSSALKHGDEETSDIIEKLSGLLRYNLYECNEPTVDLEKELSYIENYISLQTKRLSDDLKPYLKIHIDKSGSNYKIAPFLLISFVENVFKHGIILSNPGILEISIQIRNNQLTLYTKNPYAPAGKNTGFGGIGTQNARTRLELLYRDKHTLVNKTVNNHYITELTIQLQ